MNNPELDRLLKQLDPKGGKELDLTEILILVSKTLSNVSIVMKHLNSRIKTLEEKPCKGCGGCGSQK